MISITLDSDESNMVQIDNIGAINSIDEILAICTKKMKVDVSTYGLKTKTQQILICDIGDLDANKK